MIGSTEEFKLPIKSLLKQIDVEKHLYENPLKQTGRDVKWCNSNIFPTEDFYKICQSFLTQTKSKEWFLFVLHPEPIQTVLNEFAFFPFFRFSLDTNYSDFKLAIYKNTKSLISDQCFSVAYPPVKIAAFDSSEKWVVINDPTWEVCMLAMDDKIEIDKYVKVNRNFYSDAVDATEMKLEALTGWKKILPLYKASWGELA